MTFRPGRRLLSVAIALAVVSLLVFVWPPLIWLMALLLLVVAGAAVRDGLAAKKSLAEILVERDTPQVVGRDLSIAASYRVINPSDSACRIEFRDQRPHTADPNYAWSVLDLPPRDEATREEIFRIPTRGEYTLGPIWVRTAGPWGLIESQHALKSTASIRVLPETFASREELIKDVGAELQMLDRIRKAQQKGGGTEFDSLYPYQYGDDPRRIDWRATARSRLPIVRHYQVERHRDVMIIVDCGRLMAGDAGRGTKLDRAVDSALHVAGVALRSGDRCGVGVFDDRVRGYLPPVSGVASLRAVVDSLYAAQTEWRESDFTRMFAELQARQAKRSLVVVISDLSDQESSAQLRSSLLRLSRRHLVLFAALKTPMLARVIEEPTTSLDRGSRKAVVMRLVRERRRSLQELERGGVQVLDVEPRQLTLPLINRFLTLRTGRLL